MQQDRSLKGKDKAQSYQFMLRLKVRCGLHSCQAHQPGNGRASSCARPLSSPVRPTLRHCPHSKHQDPVHYRVLPLTTLSYQVPCGEIPGPLYAELDDISNK